MTTLTEQDKRLLQYVDDVWRTTSTIFLIYSGGGANNTPQRKRRRWMFSRLEALRDAGLVESRLEEQDANIVGYWRLRGDPGPRDP